MSIEKLTPDLTSTTQEAVGPEFFPDDYVESPALFKRGNTYFVTYGSCCCGCREGGGITVFTAPSVQGSVVVMRPLLASRVSVKTNEETLN